MALSGRIPLIVAENPQLADVVRAVAHGGSRGDASGMTPDSRERIERQHIETKRCLALLAEAIARAERWYARQEAERSAFDRRATRTVDWLRTGGWVGPAIVWNPSRI